MTPESRTRLVASRLVLALCAGLGTFACAPTMALPLGPPVRRSPSETPSTRLPVEAAIRAGEMHVRTESGGYATVTLDGGEVRWWTLGKGLLDLLDTRDGLWGLVEEEQGSLLVKLMPGEGWFEVGRFPAAEIQARVVELGRGKLGVLVDSELHLVGEPDVLSVDFVVKGSAGHMTEPPGTIGASESGAVYVGISRGEWGGALGKVDLKNGGLTELEDSSVGGPHCFGPYDPDCDPVRGLVADPDRSECVLVAVGLMHFEPSGRLLRACGESVEVVWPSKWEGPSTLSNKIAIFGLTLTGAVTYFNSSDGVYEYTSARKVRPLHLHHVAKRATVTNSGQGLSVQRVDDELFVVSTSPQEAFPPAGPTPVLVRAW